MSTKELTQDEANSLLKVAKSRIDDATHIFPAPGKQLQISLRSTDSNHEFQLNIRSSKIELKRGTCQIRFAIVHTLVRLDLAGGMHRNPNGEEIACPHIHLYREGHGDKWAYPLPEVFSSPEDLWKTLDDFFGYCNIVDKPLIQRE